MALWNFAYVLHPACRAEYAAMRCKSWLLATLKLGKTSLQKSRTLFKIFDVSRGWKEISNSNIKSRFFLFFIFIYKQKISLKKLRTSET